MDTYDIRNGSLGAGEAHNEGVPNRDLEAILGKLRDIQPSLREQYAVSGLWVFGSYVRGEQKRGSDLDVLVEFDRPGMTLFKLVDIEFRLSGHLGVKVDLVQRRALRPSMSPGVLAEAVAI